MYARRSEGFPRTGCFLGSCACSRQEGFRSVIAFVFLFLQPSILVLRKEDFRVFFRIRVAAPPGPPPSILSASARAALSPPCFPRVSVRYVHVVTVHMYAACPLRTYVNTSAACPLGVYQARASWRCSSVGTSTTLRPRPRTQACPWRSSNACGIATRARSWTCSSACSRVSKKPTRARSATSTCSSSSSAGHRAAL